MNAVAVQSQHKPRFSNDDDRWSAIVQRDSRADGEFFYSVKTTGVYCRPGCPARQARRENVRFHATAEAAKRAGFRPCRRCRPDTLSLIEQHKSTVTQACRLIENSSEAPDLRELAAAAGLSSSHFQRVFKAIVGVTPKGYAVALRSRRVKQSLADSGTVTAAIYGAGFNSSSRFYTTSSNELGMTPTALRAQGKGATIRFAVGVCSLGSILVAATGAGICSIAIGDEPDRLVRELQDRFAQAELSAGNKAFQAWVARAVGLVDDPARGCELPLDIRGTAFQRRVWQALREIPCGQTRTYAQIAQALGQPKAVRAVARACAANELAVAIPCHRVVRTDGSLSGYRWGVERKAALLKRERQ